MIPALLTMAALAGPAEAAKFRLERIELVSDDTGMWLNYDVPMIGAHPLMTGLRLLEQTQLVWDLPGEHLKLGTSLESQSLTYERGFNVDLSGGDLGWYGGISTRLLLPRGGMLGLAWQKDRWRLALGTAVTTAATWRRPSLKVWTVLPTLSVAVVTGKQDGAKRFRSEPVDRSQFRTDEVPEGAPGTEPVEGAAPVEGTPPVEGATPVEGEATDTTRVLPPSGEGAPAEAPPEGEATEATDTTRVLPAGTAEGAPSEVELPPAEEVPAEEVPAEEAPAQVEIAAPTGPTAVEFTAPTQVLLPGSGPVEVIIGGGEEEEDDSSQPGDTNDDGG